MYLRKCTNKKTGRTQLSIVQGYRDASGKVRQKTILPVGYLDVLQKQYGDPIGHPISYGLFSGNTLDKQTLIPMMGKLQDDYSLGRIIVVADRGLITGDNIFQTLSDGNGYILSYSIRGSDKAFQNYVLDPAGYIQKKDGFRIKSRLAPRKIRVTDVLTGKKKDLMVDEKHVVFYSPAYAKKAKMEREEVLKKAKSMIQEPQKYTRSTSYGAAKYIKNLSFDKETGEILTHAGKALELDEKLIAEEELYDGYYAIVTSEHKLSDGQIIDIYRGLWKIEESFRITKSDLETRPVYLQDLEHIQAHFLICFVALVLARLLENRLGRKYGVSPILESLRKCECSLIEQNIYVFDYYDEILKDIGELLNIDFSKKYRTLGEIKKVLGDVKRRGKTQP